MIPIYAGILTWNPTRTGRFDLLRQAHKSLEAEADLVFVYDNGSDDGTSLAPWQFVRNQTWNTTCGYGTWATAKTAVEITYGLRPGEDIIIVVSDDDMWWRPGWADQLREFWADPDRALLAGGHLEPEFPWNKITGTEPGVLWRDSTGAASWTFHTRNWNTLSEIVRPVPITRQGYWDVPVCHAIRAAGYRIAQLDLADHHGTVSTWGNGTVDTYGWQIDKVREKIQ